MANTMNTANYDTKHQPFLSLKEEKELFVTGHTGTTPMEILLVCVCIPIGLCLYQMLLADLATEKKRKQGNTFIIATTNISLILVEIFFLLLPMLLCQTNYLYSYGAAVLVAEVAASIGIFLFYRRKKRSCFKISDINIYVDATDQQKKTQQTQQQPPLSSKQQMLLAMPLSSATSLILSETEIAARKVVTVYRSSVQYLTFIAILAVDFNVFPRRFAKTEIFGYGFMDLGAGSFVVAAAMVSSRARQQKQQRYNNSRNTNALSTRKVLLLRVLPLFALGTVRIITNKGIEYQEHVSEYGSHWNFPYTLAVLNLLDLALSYLSMSSFAPSFLRHGPSWVLPAVSLLFYEIALSSVGLDLQNYIATAQRHCNDDESFFCINFFASNREGIVGCLGYFLLYLLSEKIAHEHVWNNHNKHDNRQSYDQDDKKNGIRNDGSSKTGKTKQKATNKNTKTNFNFTISPAIATSARARTRNIDNFLLYKVSCGLWVLHFILVHFLKVPVSRRSTNSSFILWTCAHNFLLLAMIQTCFDINSRTSSSVISNGLRFANHNVKNGSGDCSKQSEPVVFVSNAAVPVIFDCVNRHGLLMFIIANLLTGLVNISINTLQVKDIHAIAILSIYISIVSAIALLLDRIIPTIVYLFTKKTKGEAKTE